MIGSSWTSGPPWFTPFPAGPPHLHPRPVHPAPNLCCPALSVVVTPALEPAQGSPPGHLLCGCSGDTGSAVRGQASPPRGELAVGPDGPHPAAVDSGPAGPSLLAPAPRPAWRPRGPRELLSGCGCAPGLGQSRAGGASPSPPRLPDGGGPLGQRGAGCGEQAPTRGVGSRGGCEDFPVERASSRLEGRSAGGERPGSLRQRSSGPGGGRSMRLPLPRGRGQQRLLSGVPPGPQSGSTAAILRRQQRADTCRGWSLGWSFPEPEEEARGGSCGPRPGLLLLLLQTRRPAGT